MPPTARGNPAHWWKSRSCGKGSRAPSATFVSPFRRTLSALFLLTLCLILVGGWYITRPARISRMAEVLLTRLIGGTVNVQSGHLSLSGTFLLSGVNIETQSENGQLPLPVFSAERIEARFDWISLVFGELHSTQLTAIRPTLYLVEDRDIGKWNYELMHKTSPASTETRPSLSAPPTMPALPVILLRDARIQWGDVDKGVLTETGSAVVDGQLTPGSASPSTYRLELAQRSLAGPTDPSTVGPLVAENAQPVTIDGTWETLENKFSAATHEIRLTDALKKVLPRAVQAAWTEHEIQGTLSQLWVTFDKDAGLVVGADAKRLDMVLKVTPPLGEQLYRVKVGDVRGSLVVGVTKQTITASGITGQLSGFAFRADAQITGITPTSPFALNFRFPNAVLGDDYPPFFIAFPASQDLLQRLAPHGMFDLAVSVHRDAGDPSLLVNGHILCQDARMRFGPFPYPLTHVNGPVDFDQQSVTFRDVTANADETLVHIDGVTGTNPQFPKIDFRVWSDNAVFDDRLGACLPDKFAKVWDQFVVHGKGTFECLVRRDHDPNVQPQVTVGVTLTDGSGYAKLAPYPFYDAHGTFMLAADQTTVNDMTVRCGLDRSGVVRLNGVIDHPGGDVANLLPKLTINAELPIDHALLTSLPEAAGDKLKGMTIAGRVGFIGKVERVASLAGDATGGVHVAGNLALKDASLSTQDKLWNLTHIAAAAHIEQGSLDITAARAQLIEGLHLDATGSINFLKQTGELHLAAIGDDIDIPAEAPSIAPASARDLWHTYQPSGKVGIHGTALITIGAQTSTTQPAATFPGVSVQQYSCTLTPNGVTLANPAWPEKITDIRGGITITPAQLAATNLTAKSGPLSLTANGTYQIASGACALDAAVTSDNLLGNWITMLPTGVSKFFDAHKTTGALQLTVSKMSRTASDQTWNYAADFDLKRFTMDGVVALSADDLRLTSEGSLTPQKIGFTGNLTGTNVGLAGKTLDTLAATIDLSGADHSIHMTDIDAKVAGGSIQGIITVEPAGEGRYEANLSLKDAQMADLLLARTASADERAKVGEGLVSATLAVQQTFGDHGDRTGRGELMVTDGKIYNVPLAMGLMQLVTLRLPVARAFDRATMSYFLRDNKVTFERILLESPSINLAGSGTMSLSNKALDLNFVTESPNALHLPIISPIITQIRDELLQLAVTGTIDNPKVTPVPLSALSAPLRAFLPHHQQANEK